MCTGQEDRARGHLLQISAAIPSLTGHKEGRILDLGRSVRPFCMLLVQGAEG